MAQYWTNRHRGRCRVETWAGHVIGPRRRAEQKTEVQNAGTLRPRAKHPHTWKHTRTHAHTHAHHPGEIRAPVARVPAPESGRELVRFGMDRGRASNDRKQKRRNGDSECPGPAACDGGIGGVQKEEQLMEDTTRGRVRFSAGIGGYGGASPTKLDQATPTCWNVETPRLA